MKRLLPALALLAACQPARSTPPTPWAQQADVAVRECLAEHGFTVTGSFDSVVVHDACWVWEPYSKRWLRGYPVGGTIHVGADWKAYRHELAHVLTRDRRHAHNSPAILCEHAGAPPPPYQCEEKPQ